MRLLRNTKPTRPRRWAVLAAMTAAVVAVAPVPATAAQGILNTDLQITLGTLQPGSTMTVTFRITNHGPDSLPAGSYGLRVNWGPFVRQAADSTACIPVGAFICEFEGLELEYIEGGPLPGPEFVTYTVRLTSFRSGVQGAVVAEIQQLGYLDSSTPDVMDLDYTTR